MSSDARVPQVRTGYYRKMAGLAFVVGLLAVVSEGCGSGSSSPPPPPPPSPNAKLNGHYAFLFNGMDDATGQQVAIAGSFSADGAGNIADGVEDINGPSASPLCNAACPQLNVPITGTYSIGADNRGTATITNAIGATKYAIALGSLDGSGAAQKIRFIEFDDTTGTAGTRGSGTMYLQESIKLSQSQFSGPYAFGILGQGSSAQRVAMVGRFDADGNGNISNGNGWIEPLEPIFRGAFSGTYTAPDTNGRLTGALTSTAPTIDFASYLVSANESILITTDPVSAGFLSGTMTSQASTSFSDSSLPGPFVASLTQANGVAAMAVIETQVDASSGADCLNVVDAYFNGGEGAILLGGFLLIGSNGSGTASFADVAPGAPCFAIGGPQGDNAFYLTDIDQGSWLSRLPAGVEFGSFEPQAQGISQSSLSGTYFVGTSPINITGSITASGVLTADGKGTIKMTSDTAPGGGVLNSGQTQSLSYTVEANGYVTIGKSIVGYVISPTKLIFVDTSNPAFDIYTAEQ